MEWAHAIAPGANIVLVQAQDASHLENMVQFAKLVPGVSVISMNRAIVRHERGAETRLDLAPLLAHARPEDEVSRLIDSLFDAPGRTARGNGVGS